MKNLNKYLFRVRLIYSVLYAWLVLVPAFFIIFLLLLPVTFSITRAFELIYYEMGIEDFFYLDSVIQDWKRGQP